MMIPPAEEEKEAIVEGKCVYADADVGFCGLPVKSSKVVMAEDGRFYIVQICTKEPVPHMLSFKMVAPSSP